MKGGKNVKRASTLRNLKEENGQQKKKKAHNSRPQFALSCSISRIVHLFVQHCTFADYLREKKKRQQVHFECLQSTSSQRV